MKKTLVLLCTSAAGLVVSLCCHSSETHKEPPRAAPLHSIDAVPVQVEGSYQLVKSELGQTGQARAYVLLAEQGVFIGSIAEPSLPASRVGQEGVHEALAKLLDEQPIPKAKALTAVDLQAARKAAMAQAINSHDAVLSVPDPRPPNPDRAPLLMADEGQSAAELIRVLSSLMRRGAFIAVAGANGTRRHVVFLEENHGRFDWIPTASVLIRDRELVVSYGYENYSYKGTTCVIAKNEDGEPDWRLLEKTLKAVGVEHNSNTIGVSAESKASSVAEVVGILDVAAVTGFPVVHASLWMPRPADFPRDYNPKSGATEEEHQRFDEQLLSCDEQLQVTGADVTMEDEYLHERTQYFRSCYQGSLIRGESPKGQLVAGLRSSGDGRIDEVSFDGENGDYLEQCFAHQLKDVRFVEYPRSFSATFELVAPAQ